MKKKNEIGYKLKNSFSNSSRFIQTSNTKKVITFDYIKSHEYHTKIPKTIFLETFIK